MSGPAPWAVEPSKRLAWAIARLATITALAAEAASDAHAPEVETLAQIQELGTETLILMKSLTGQVGGAA